MIHIDNQSQLDIQTELIEDIAQELSDKDIELILTDAKSIQDINREYRGIDKPTDVLSFPLDEMPHVPLGSIVMNAQMIEDKASELQHTVQDEFTLLFIHGLLHLLGYDHEVDQGEMRQKEKEIITKYNLPQSLILRNGDEK